MLLYGGVDSQDKRLDDAWLLHPATCSLSSCTPLAAAVLAGVSTCAPVSCLSKTESFIFYYYYHNLPGSGRLPHVMVR